jgi:hypothetical protein
MWLVQHDIPKLREVHISTFNKYYRLSIVLRDLHKYYVKRDRGYPYQP